MKKFFDLLSIIIVIGVIIISCNVISNNFTTFMQNKYFLDINSENKEYIETMISENYKLSGTLEKVAYMQGLGDWYLFLYYDNGLEDDTLFGDSNREVQPLRDYIIQNGNNNDAFISKIKIDISIICILISIVYSIIYIIIKIKIRNKELLNSNK